MHAKADEQQEALVDKLRGGDFNQLIDGSLQMMEKQMEQEQQLCLTADGGVYKGNPLETRGKPSQNVAKENNDPDSAGRLDADDLESIRRARIEEMKREKLMKDHWRSQGHGRYREIENERSFFTEVGPHERAVCVVHGDNDDLGNDLHTELGALAESHLETAFLRLRESKAHFMLQMLDLEGLPSIFILRHGKVTTSIGPSVLRRCTTSASVRRLLWSHDVLGVGDSHSEYSDDE